MVNINENTPTNYNKAIKHTTPNTPLNTVNLH